MLTTKFFCNYCDEEIIPAAVETDGSKYREPVVVTVDVDSPWSQIVYTYHFHLDCLTPGVAVIGKHLADLRTHRHKLAKGGMDEEAVATAK